MWCLCVYQHRSSTAGSVPPSLSRLIHTRTAHSRTSRSGDTMTDHPPMAGVVLTPSPCVGGGCEAGDGGESDMDVSDQEEPSRLSATVDSHNFNRSTHSIPTQPFAFLDLDSDQSDDDEFPSLPGMMYQFEGDAVVQSEESDEERLEDIYPYAWALDGRRIGETSSSSNHQNVMANISLVRVPSLAKSLLILSQLYILHTFRSTVLLYKDLQICYTCRSTGSSKSCRSCTISLSIFF